MSPDWLFLEKLSCLVAKNDELQHVVLEKAKKYRYFFKIRQIIALIMYAHRRDWKANLWFDQP
jgi:hypothetical protein